MDWQVLALAIGGPVLSALMGALVTWLFMRRNFEDRLDAESDLIWAEAESWCRTFADSEQGRSPVSIAEPYEAGRPGRHEAPTLAQAPAAATTPGAAAQAARDAEGRAWEQAGRAWISDEFLRIRRALDFTRGT